MDPLSTISMLGDSLASPPKPSCYSQGRKRKRAEIPNPANTLDGLVARKAEDSRCKLAGRYLTEIEAIESPDDHTEIRRIETDPDVSTRTCSICGYQGKWVSEMIRHKRVHTHERPFKCRYCSRTSKWKADLIRHVAKTHGIRVVSKYSRSKTYSATTQQSLHDDYITTAFIEQQQQENAQQDQLARLITAVPSLENMPCPIPRVTSNRPAQNYGCNRCPYEHEALSIFLLHLRSQHGISAYSCECGLGFDAMDAVRQHLFTSCRDEQITTNFTIRYNRAANLSAVNIFSPSSSSEGSVDSGIHSDTEDSDQESSRHGEAEARIRGRDGSIHMPTPILPLLPNFSLYPLSTSLQSPQNALSPLISPSSVPKTFPTATMDLASIILALQAQAAKMLLTNDLSTFLSPHSAFTPTTAFLGTQNAERSFASATVHENRTCERCSLCEAVFDDQLHLAAHLRFHGSGLPRSCTLCNYASGTEVNLHRHITTHHRISASDVLVSLPELAEEGSDDELVDVVEM